MSMNVEDTRAYGRLPMGPAESLSQTCQLVASKMIGAATVDRAMPPTPTEDRRNDAQKRDGRLRSAFACTSADRRTRRRLRRAATLPPAGILPRGPRHR